MGTRLRPGRNAAGSYIYAATRVARVRFHRIVRCLPCGTSCGAAGNHRGLPSCGLGLASCAPPAWLWSALELVTSPSRRSVAGREVKSLLTSWHWREVKCFVQVLHRHSTRSTLTRGPLCWNLLDLAFASGVSWLSEVPAVKLWSEQTEFAGQSLELVQVREALSG